MISSPRIFRWRYKIAFPEGMSQPMLTPFSFRAKSALIVLLLAVAACGLQAQRLPATVVPSNYKLSLDPDIAEQKFSGEETITVRVQQPVREIVLNSLGLEISLAEAAPGLDKASL